MKKLILAILVLGITQGFANGPQNGKGPKGGTPPPGALDACIDKESGDTCTMKTRRGDTLSGTCTNTPDNKFFVCMPEGMERR